MFDQIDISLALMYYEQGLKANQDFINKESMGLNG